MSFRKKIHGPRLTGEGGLIYSTKRTQPNETHTLNSLEPIPSSRYEEGEIVESEDESQKESKENDRHSHRSRDEKYHREGSSRSRERHRHDSSRHSSSRHRDDRYRDSRDSRGDRHRRHSKERRYRSRSPSDLRNSKKLKNDEDTEKSVAHDKNGKESVKDTVTNQSKADPNAKNGVKDKPIIDIDFASSSSGESISKALEERRKRRQNLMSQLPIKNPNVQRVISTDLPSTSVPSSPTTTEYASTPNSSHYPAEDDASPVVLDLEKHEAKPLTKVEDTLGDQVLAADYNPNADRVEDDFKREHTTKIINNVADDQDEEDIDDMFNLKPTKVDINNLTTKDLKTKQLLNAAIPTNTSATINVSALDNRDDEEGYYVITLGEVLNSRYRVSSVLGKGVFSAVVHALDLKSETNETVAIKIIRNNPVMYKAGLKETSILKKLGNADPSGKKHVIKLLDTFEHHRHLCLVFESMEFNLREVLKKFGKQTGINLKAIKIYAHHIFLGFSLLNKLELLHADLKPDNILVNAAYNTVKVCDLGSASYESEGEITPYLVSRYYRAPEIILGLPYSYPIDVWSIGCTLYELYTGSILFPGGSNNHMLYQMMQLRGKFPNRMIRKGTLSHLHFDQNNQFLLNEIDPISQLPSQKPVNFPPKPARDLKMKLGIDDTDKGTDEHTLLTHFLDLLEGCLTLNPEKRITVKECLNHPFIKTKI